jgi:hypothetical protein
MSADQRIRNPQPVTTVQVTRCMLAACNHQTRSIPVLAEGAD